MNQKETYKIIRGWELENGEGFFEYFGDNGCNINTVSLMFWLYGKGYIDVNKINLFAEALDNAKKSYGRPSSGDCLCGYEKEYSLFPYGECDEEAQFKAEIIVAEFIAENKSYEERLRKFAFEGEGWASFDSEKDKIEYAEGMHKYVDNWDAKDDEEYEKVLKLNIGNINGRLLEENNN